MQMNDYRSSKKLNFKNNFRMSVDIQKKNIKRSNSDIIRNLNEKKKKKIAKIKSLNSFHTMILNIDNNNNNLGINDNFIPKTSSNFLFDTNTFSYQLSNDKNNDKKLNEILKQKSLLKIKEYNEQLKLREKDKKKIINQKFWNRY